MVVWKYIPGYEGYYEVSNKGLVRSVERIVKGRFGGVAVRRGVLLRPGKSKTGYMRCLLVKDNVRKNIGVHRLVALAFIPNPDNKKTVNHINGIKTDNRVENLEWCTVAENNRHARRLGLNIAKSGKEHHSYGLNNKSALVLKNIHTGSLKSVREVADEYGVTGRHITMMIKGERTNKTNYKLIDRSELNTAS